jgi:hypothetical protein
MSGDPPNIHEFNIIAGFVFAQLYEVFPSRKNIDLRKVAKGMGVDDSDWGAHKLPTGRVLRPTISDTIYWLDAEGFIKSYGDQVVLTTKGLAAMSAVPEGLNKEKLGVQLTKAVDKAQSSAVNTGAIGDLIGGFFGGLMKSIGNG